jgi:hypothetical protein
LADVGDRRYLTYDGWISILGEHFFADRFRGRPVAFFVDDDLLDRLSGLAGAGAGAKRFLDAVNPVIRPDSYGRPFHHVYEDRHVPWKVRGAKGYPPSLPLLALLVLAGSHMAKGEEISSANYWERFAELTKIEGSAGRDEIPAMWDDFAWWLDVKLAGINGLSTVKQDPNKTIIGYALSQALFRGSDRQKLTRFFRRIDLEPGELLPQQELLEYFKAWAPGSSLSDGAKRMAAATRFDDRLGAILADEVAAWDGIIRDETGRRIGAIFLAFDPTEKPHFCMAAEKPESFPVAATFRDRKLGFEVSLEMGPASGYLPLWPLSAKWLKNGLTVESGDFILAYEPKPVIPLGIDHDLGCWASVSRIQPHQEYRILVEAGQSPEVSAYLRQVARPAWQSTDAARFGVTVGLCIRGLRSTTRFRVYRGFPEEQKFLLRL